MAEHAKRALVTGGAGLIGSHLVDLLIREGWTVRILDNLEPNTHKHGKPAWVNPAAEFRQGEVQDYETMRSALEDIDVVFHEAAYGGYMPEMAKYVLVNSFGTAQLLEIIRDHKLPVKKVVVASSQAVYSEGAAECPEHGHVVPKLRPAEQLRAGDFAVHCPVCGKVTTSIATPESTPGGGETVYGLTKFDQERLVLLWGKQTGVPTVALRYSCTYGPRQSLFNPYTGVIAIFCTRLLNDLPPVMYEDGGQTRDLCFVEDIARANLMVAETSALDGLPVNVGSGVATSVRDLAGMIARKLGREIAPLARGEFRPGEIRSLISDTSRIQSIGYKPSVTVEEGIGRYIDWVMTQGPVKDYFGEIEAGLRAKGIVQSVKG
ncbi:nucleoside-diphosphate-sugar epimerase [Terriglobus roseus DSM 18391]|uniref:Nucleoside-diphosphate-sugar epimerase n=1 Tax=Terriglobus roseus (strain DSM 18391 / NRRL B-41598 / KBS 63) TaxID=926566 RepID=I3ZKI1_TERRK|nr:NAD-dependent epimerase/dehydratase family protein [Terriglobus roseus]AFL89749.1 nucleoside-diphosphate-sugar epimerase [Terriglobus roseus DSM 18391]